MENGPMYRIVPPEVRQLLERQAEPDKETCICNVALLLLRKMNQVGQDCDVPFIHLQVYTYAKLIVTCIQLTTVAIVILSFKNTIFTFWNVLWNKSSNTLVIYS